MKKNNFINSIIMLLSILSFFPFFDEFSQYQVHSTRHTGLGWMSTLTCRKVSTLILIVEQVGLTQRRILLGMKKRGFGEGKWNGFGGKVENDETVFDGAMRELQEECSITAENMTQAGLLAFDFPDESCDPLLVHVFKASAYTGTIAESEEMRPCWFDVNEIPFEEMWQDDILWFPHLLADRPFVGKCVFKEVHTMVSHEIRELDNDESFEDLAKTI